MANWQRSKAWFANLVQRPKKTPPSLELLKHIHIDLLRPCAEASQDGGLQRAGDSYQRQLVEAFRSVAEILIWGDQNDTRVFDYFMEHNMLAFFLKALSQNSDPRLTVQLLQSLSIIFENISNEMVMYYLLSNNHVNSMIAHKFDFDNEEVLAYYISLLKTLSLRLNKHTVHLFYNEHLRDFPLLTEAIQFFAHPESMVRVAVRTITLNIFRVADARVISFVCERESVGKAYFARVMWYIGSIVLSAEEQLRGGAGGGGSLEAMLDNHLDHWTYLNDVLVLQQYALSELLLATASAKLLEPLYLASFLEQWEGQGEGQGEEQEEGKEESVPHISKLHATFFLAQVISVVDQESLVCPLVERLLRGPSPSHQESCPGLLSLLEMVAAVRDDTTKEHTCQLALLLLNVMLDNRACSQGALEMMDSHTPPESSTSGCECLSTTVQDCLSAVCCEGSSMSGSTAMLCLELLGRIECDTQECLKVCEQSLSLRLQRVMQMMAADEFVGVYRWQYKKVKSQKSCTSELVNSGRVLVGVVHREEEESSKVMELFFAVHHWLGTQEAELLPPLGLLLHVGDILQLSGFNMFYCHAVLGNRETEQFVAVSSSQCCLVEPDRLPGQGKVKYVINLDELEYTPDPATTATVFISQRGRRLSFRLRFTDPIMFRAAIKSLGRNKSQMLRSQIEFIASLLHTTPPETFDEDELSYEIIQLDGGRDHLTPTTPIEELEMVPLPRPVDMDSAVSFKKDSERVQILSTAMSEDQEDQEDQDQIEEEEEDCEDSSSLNHSKGNSE